MKLLKYILPIVLAFFCASCFTGIESTKKIALSREDKRIAAPTNEEKFISGVNSIPLKDWQQGKIFIAGDNKALLIFDAQPLTFPPDTTSIKGKELNYLGIQSRVDAAGRLTVCLDFSDGTRFFTYPTGKEFDDAMESIMSDEIPMLIDKDMVAQARNLLTGKEVWTRSSLWYDKDGERINGKKFIPVIINDVQPGNMIFPLFIEIVDPQGEKAYMYMNLGNSDTESRAFHNLFSLSDIRKNYPNIAPEIWDLISIGKVKVGMTKEEVKLSLGNPTGINSGHDYSQTIDIWSFDNGTVLWFEDGILTRLRQ